MVLEPSDVTEEGAEKPPVQGVVSVVYADGPGNPPTLLSTGAPGYPERLLLVDGTGAPVATYTAGPAIQTRGVDLDEIVYGAGLQGLLGTPPK